MAVSPCLPGTDIAFIERCAQLRLNSLQLRARSALSAPVTTARMAHSYTRVSWRWSMSLTERASCASSARRLPPIDSCVLAWVMRALRAAVGRSWTMSASATVATRAIWWNQAGVIDRGKSYTTNALAGAPSGRRRWPALSSSATNFTGSSMRADLNPADDRAGPRSCLDVKYTASST